MSTFKPPKVENKIFLYSLLLLVPAGGLRLLLLIPACGLTMLLLVLACGLVLVRARVPACVIERVCVCGHAHVHPHPRVQPRAQV